MIQAKILPKILEQITNNGVECSLLLNNKGNLLGTYIDSSKLSSYSDNSVNIGFVSAIVSNIFNLYDKCSKKNFQSIEDKQKEFLMQKLNTTSEGSFGTDNTVSEGIGEDGESDGEEFYEEGETEDDEGEGEQGGKDKEEGEGEDTKENEVKGEDDKKDDNEETLDFLIIEFEPDKQIVLFKITDKQPNKFLLCLLLEKGCKFNAIIKEKARIVCKHLKKPFNKISQYF